MRKLRYQALGPLLSGEGSRAYLGLEISNESKARPVVLVWVTEEANQDPALLERIRKEIEHAATLEHPNIMRVKGFASLDEGHARVVEFADGESLRRILEVVKVLPPKFAVKIVADAAMGVHYGHIAGNDDGTPLLHGDLRPETLIVSFSGVSKVSGYGALGVAPRDLTGQLERRRKLHSAPEQIIGGRTAMVLQTDVYLLGLTLYECLTGKVPFANAPDPEQAVLSSLPPPIEVAGCPLTLKAVVGQSLAKKAADRYSTPLAFKEALEMAIGALPTNEELAAFLLTAFPVSEERRAARSRVLDAGIAEFAREQWDSQPSGIMPSPKWAAAAQGEPEPEPEPAPTARPPPEARRAATAEPARPRPEPVAPAPAPRPPAPVPSARSQAPMAAPEPEPAPVPIPQAAPPAPAQAPSARPVLTPSAPQRAAPAPAPKQKAAEPKDPSIRPAPSMGPAAAGKPVVEKKVGKRGPPRRGSPSKGAGPKRRSLAPLIILGAGVAGAGVVYLGLAFTAKSRPPTPVQPAPKPGPQPTAAADGGTADAGTTEAGSADAGVTPTVPVPQPPPPPPPTAPDAGAAKAVEPPPPPKPIDEGPPSLALTVEPPVTLTIDGKPSGRSPFNGRLAPGQHIVLLVDKIRNISTSRAITVRPKGKTQEDIVLGRGSVSLTAPDGAVVFIDGRRMGKAPLKEISLWEGRHKAVVTVGKLKWQQAFTVHEGEHQYFNVEAQ